MIQMQTKLVVADNSGVKTARCIKVLGGSKHMIAGIGEVIKISATAVATNSKIKKGEIARAVIVRTKSRIARPDGSFIVFDDNAIVLVDNDNEPIGTRTFGPVAREVRKEGFFKIASLASEVL